MNSSSRLARSPWLVLAGASLAVFAVSLDTLVLLVSFPALQRSFPAVSNAQLSWILNSYTIVYGALLAPVGQLADQFGRKRVFLLGVALFTLASLCCAFAPDPTWLIALRALQGIGAAMLLPSSLALTLAAFPQAARNNALAVWTAITAFGVVAGPPLGSLIVVTIGWPGIFLLNVPIGVIAVLLGNRFIAESRNTAPGSRPDLFGALLLIIGVSSFTLALLESAQWGWASSWTWMVLLAGLLLLSLFWRRSRRVASPALDVTLFEDSTFRRANLANLLFSIGMTSLFFGSTPFLMRLWGFSQVQAGLALVPGPLMVVMIAPFVGRLIARYGYRRLLILGGLLYAIGSGMLLVGASAAPQFLTLWLPALLLAGIGVALVRPTLNGAALQNLTTAQLGVGSGAVQAIWQFGSVLAVAIVAPILGVGVQSIRAFDWVFLLMTLGGLAASLSGLNLPQRLEKPAHETEATSQSA